MSASFTRGSAKSTSGNSRRPAGRVSHASQPPAGSLKNSSKLGAGAQRVDHAVAVEVDQAHVGVAEAAPLARRWYAHEALRLHRPAKLSGK